MIISIIIKWFQGPFGKPSSNLMSENQFVMTTMNDYEKIEKIGEGKRL